MVKDDELTGNESPGNEKSAHIHAEVRREDKGAWVRESRRRNMKLVDWIVETLNAAIKKWYQ